MTPTAPGLTAETRPMDRSAWPPAETDLYDAGVATLLASWERYTHGSGGAAVHRLTGVAAAVFPTEPEADRGTTIKEGEVTGILVLKPVRRVLLLAGLVFAGMPAGSALAASPCGTSGQFSQSGATATCTYSNPGTEDTFTVPAGISSVSVSAFGAPGGAVDLHTAAAAGLGAKVVNTGLPVAVGSTLSVDVGQAGPPAPGGICFSPPGAGGLFDGGGGNECSGGGGGSSALLTTPRASAQLTGDPATDGRLLVAGGGGGAGTADGANGGSAGDSAVTGAGSGNCDAPGVGAPGGIGPTDGTAGGGAGCGGGADGTASGGGAGSSSGGGGGGGWFGGGGGGQGSTQGGGGGGSSYGGAGPAGGTSIVTAASTDTPQVVISYTASAPTAWITTPADGASFAQGTAVGSTRCSGGARLHRRAAPG